ASTMRQMTPTRRCSPRPALTSDGSRGRTSASTTRLPTSVASAASPAQRIAVARRNWTVMVPLLDPEREAPFRPVAVARDHAPEDLVRAWRQRGHAHLEQRAVPGVDARIPVVDPALVAVLDAERAEHGLDRPVEPDADRARRVHRVPHARLRMVGKRVSPRRGRREQEQGRQQPRAHYPTGECPNGPLRDPPGARTKITGSSPTATYPGCVG